MKQNWVKKITVLFATLFILGGCSTSTTSTSSSSFEKETKIENSSSENKESQEKEAEKKKAAEKKKQEKKKTKEQEKAKKVTKETKDLANLVYSGKQTIEINQNVPTFSKEDLSLKKGAWEKYDPLDNLNRATKASAMLNQSLMPKEKRGDISSVTPTGWKNKKIAGGYLYNRSHLIGFALAGENANWKNLITGTRQLNSPEMLRFEMDVKYYLDQSKDHYVRYEVTPIFKNDELLARGVHMMAKSIGDNTISFNVYIFNIQDGVELNYKDGSSKVIQKKTTPSKKETAQPKTLPKENQQEEKVYVTKTGKKYHTHPHGNGNFTETTLSKALKRGLTPCKICY